jgi:hypothetical protein
MMLSERRQNALSKLFCWRSPSFIRAHRLDGVSKRFDDIILSALPSLPNRNPHISSAHFDRMDVLDTIATQTAQLPSRAHLIRFFPGAEA